VKNNEIDDKIRSAEEQHALSLDQVAQRKKRRKQKAPPENRQAKPQAGQAASLQALNFSPFSQ